MSRTEIATPPTMTELFGNGLSNAFTSGPQIHPVNPFRAINRPMVMITITISGRCSIGRISTRSTPTPPAKAISSVSANAGQYGIPRSMNIQAMNVVNVAISPCAKLTTFVVW